MNQSTVLNGRYVLTDDVRAGGMARVYRAFDITARQEVAVKVLSTALTSDSRLVELMHDREFRSLEHLRHDNIVQLLDVGRDPDSHEPYFVLPWLERTLEDLLKESPPDGWDSFADAIAIPILKGLAHAHEQKIVHRDIKPSNILIGSSGAPQIADFGIAKLKTDFRPGLTLADYQTRPFAPKEYDDGEHSYSRDVHAFGVLVALALTGVEFTEDRYADPNQYQAIRDAMEALDVPAEVYDFVNSCVSDAAEARPLDAAIALAQIEAIQAKRRRAWIRPDVCFIKLPNKAVEQMAAFLGGVSSRHAEQAICADLSGDPGFEPLPPKDGNQKADSSHLSAYGAEYRYHLVRDQSTHDRFFVFNVWRADSARLEAQRERSFRPALAVRIGNPTDQRAARLFHDQFEQRLQEFLDERMLRDQERERKRVLWTWKRLLDAEADLEREREAPLAYKSREPGLRRITFELKDRAPEDVVGTFRSVKLEGGGHLSGEVIAQNGRELTIAPDYGDTFSVPEKGKLLVDRWPAQKAILTQRSALEAVIYNRAVRSGLGELLMSPDTSRPPEPVADVAWKNADIDAPKREAVKSALGAKDLLLVQGPPGTGKTSFITELVLQELERNPTARILIASQTHAALDNVLERVAKAQADVQLLRIARSEDPRVSMKVAEYLMDEQLARWRKDVIRQGRAYLRAWAKAHHISERAVEISVVYEELAKTRTQREERDKGLSDVEADIQELGTRTAGNRGDTDITLTDLERQRTELQGEVSKIDDSATELTQRLVTLQAIQSAEEVQGVAGDQLEQLAWNAIDRSHAAFEQCRALISLLGDWHSRFGIGAEFQGAAVLRSNVVAATCLGLRSVKGVDAIEFDLCIVDEASKATATELLVPMIQARRWLLVGDPKQLPPHIEYDLLHPQLLQEHDLIEADVRETLFDRLWERLPVACKKKLTVQHRMVAEIGTLVSDCFYDGEISNGPVTAPPGLGLVIPKPVTWYTTAGASDRHEYSVGPSKANQAEARFIRQLLGRLNFYAKTSGRPITVAVLTGYAAQQSLIQREIAEGSPDWDALGEVDCVSVDAFQGREADVAIYSVTRCNNDGNLGFVRDYPRLNVALSRGRYALVIVGDHMFAESAGDHSNPFADVVGWIREHPSAAVISETTA